MTSCQCTNKGLLDILEILQNIEKRLNNIDQRLDHIEQRLDNIENGVTHIKSSSTHMDQHIEFVETVYDTIKTPFYYILNKVAPISYIAYNQSPQQHQQLMYSHI